MDKTKYQIIVKSDTRWPKDEHGESVLVGTNPDGHPVFGWYTMAEFKRWAAAHKALVKATSTGYSVMVTLTDKQLKLYKWGT